VHKTTTLWLITLRNIHRFKKISHTLSNKTFLNLVLKTPPHLKCVATLPCNLSLRACFSDSNVSQGSVATYVRRAEILNIRLTANLLRNLSVNFFKSVKI